MLPSYNKTQWINNITKVNQANMNKIEDQLYEVTDELIKNSNSLNNKADAIHTHSTSDVNGFNDALETKANKLHQHNIGNIDGLSFVLDSKSDSNHQHSIDSISGFSNAIAVKADKVHKHKAEDIEGLDVGGIVLPKFKQYFIRSEDFTEDFVSDSKSENSNLIGPFYSTELYHNLNALKLEVYIKDYDNKDIIADYEALSGNAIKITTFDKEDLNVYVKPLLSEPFSPEPPTDPDPDPEIPNPDPEQTVWNFEYTGKVTKFKLPKPGWYKFECWGAQGGSVDAATQGGKGAYVAVTQKIPVIPEYNTVVVGESGSLMDVTQVVGPNNDVTAPGGFNGGGSVTGQGYGCSGGGATDFRTGNTTDKWQDSLSMRELVAAGGGGATKYSDFKANGSYAGTLNGIDGKVLDTSAIALDKKSVGSGGTQAKGGAYTYSSYIPTSLVTNGNRGTGGNGAGRFDADTSSHYEGGSGGGGGYYGGAGGYINTGGSGSSFVPEANSYTKDIIAIDGNSEQPAPNGGTQIGNSGNGYARVTFIESI